MHVYNYMLSSSSNADTTDLHRTTTITIIKPLITITKIFSKGRKNAEINKIHIS